MQETYTASDQREKHTEPQMSRNNDSYASGSPLIDRSDDTLTERRH